MNELNIDDIRRMHADGSVVWTIHVMKRLLKHGISMEEVGQCIESGEIIEQYPDDFPYPSCLILGQNIGNDYIHTVVGSEGTALWIITAYHPSPDKWESDFKTRKRG